MSPQCADIAQRVSRAFPRHAESLCAEVSGWEGKNDFLGNPVW